jgi:hypothetical protein
MKSQRCTGKITKQWRCIHDHWRFAFQRLSLIWISAPPSTSWNCIVQMYLLFK